MLHYLMHSQVLMAPQGDHPLDGCTQRMLAVQVSQQCLQPDKAAISARMATGAGRLQQQGSKALLRLLQRATTGARHHL